MPRTDKSVTILTGMIIAALYVVMLVGFSRESYMRRDAVTLSVLPAGSIVTDDAANRMCRIDRPVCGPATPWRPPAEAAASKRFQLSGENAPAVLSK